MEMKPGLNRRDVNRVRKRSGANIYSNLGKATAHPVQNG